MTYLISLILLILPTYLIRFSILGIPTTLLEVIIYLIFIIGLIQARGRFRKISWQLWLPIGLLFLALVISTIISPQKQTALGEFKGFFFDPILVFWLIYQFVKKEDQYRLLTGLAISGLFVAGYAIYQKFTGNVTADGRVIGIFGYSPNYTALYLAPVLVMLIAYGILFSIQKKYSLSVIIWILSVVSLAAIYITGSRGGLLAVGAGIVFYLIFYSWNVLRQKLLYKIGIIILIIVSLVTAYSIFKPDFSIAPENARASTSNNIRVLIWKTSLELGGKHPVLGVGLGNFQNAFNRLTEDRVNYSVYITPQALTPHNLFLMYWLTTGLLGFIAFIWLLVEFYRHMKASIGDKERLIFFAVVTSILIYGFLEASTWKNDLNIIFWTFYGLALI